MTSLFSDNLLRRNFTTELFERFIPLARIAEKMLGEGLSKEFVASLIPLAYQYEGVFELMLMWAEEKDKKLKDELIADLQDEIDEQTVDYLFPAQLKKDNYLHFDNLEEITKDIMAFKKSLKSEIERWGGISKLAKTTGIPQSSLSRILNSPSLPRRTTLEKIAKALKLSESHLLKKWLAA